MMTTKLKLVRSILCHILSPSVCVRTLVSADVTYLLVYRVKMHCEKNYK